MKAFSTRERKNWNVNRSSGSFYVLLYLIEIVMFKNDQCAIHDGFIREFKPSRNTCVFKRDIRFSIVSEFPSENGRVKILDRSKVLCFEFNLVDVVVCCHGYGFLFRIIRFKITICPK